MDNKEIKKNARIIIANKKFNVILFTFFIEIIFFIIGVFFVYSTIHYKFNYYVIFILMSILINVNMMITIGVYLNFERYNKFNLYNILKRWRICLKYYIFNMCILLIVRILTFVFLSAFIIFGSPLIFSALSKSWIDILVNALTIILTMYITIILNLTYFPVIYLLFHDNSLSESVRKSKNLMYKKKKKLFILKLSFIKWFVLGFLTLGIAFLIAIPYYNISLIIFYNNLICDNEEKLIEIE